MNSQNRHTDFSDSGLRYINKLIESDCVTFLSSISYEICIANKVEIRGKSENPYIHLEIDYDGDKKNKRIFAKKFIRNYVSKYFTNMIFMAIKREPLKFQRFCYDTLLSHYHKDKNRWKSLYVKRP